MGRSKSKPSRAAQTETLLLGRQSLDEDPNLHLMMGVEILEEQTEGRPSKRSQLEDLCEKIERQAKRKQRKKVDRKKPVKHVSFASATQEIGLPEIQILETDHDDIVVIHYNRQRQQADMPRKIWKLKEYEIPVATYPDEFTIQSKLGATDIWKFLGLESYDSLGHSVAEDLMVLTVSNGRLLVSLTSKAIQVANAVPLSSRSTVSIFNRNKPFYHLRCALAAVFPDSEVADLVNPLPRRETTAKEVYKWTDNVQLLTRPKARPLEIDGLVPELRPYQNAAVTWMLKRENQGSRSDEWKLAWMVLQRETVVPLSECSAAGKTLLYCPFTGWLAESVEQARTMTYGEAEASLRGGILADSMGLGKSVEVLACILANQYQRKATATCPAQRKLDFSEQSTAEPVSEEGKNPAFEDDMANFGDADDESDDDNTFEEPSVTLGASHLPVVTPCKEDTYTEEHWMDEDIVGTCICGELIGFTTNNGPGTVVVCDSCREPMHQHCANYDAEEDLKRQTKPLRFKQRFTNDQLNCRLCDKDRCPCCVETIESGATVICSPPAILNQWEREVQRHTRKDGKPLKVVVYEGIKKITQSNSIRRGSPGIKLLHPSELANADIVLLSFDALKSDLGHTDDNSYVSRGRSLMSEGNLRSRKRYRVLPSPLLSVHWWRVCLDEAQRVESPTAASAQMALKLKATHRWCVSGTPVSGGKLGDLFGLVLFLGLQPFADKSWFRKCFTTEYRRLDVRVKQLLADIFWRSTKACDSVRMQMGVPEQIEKTIVLKFSSIERHFYERQLEQTLSTADAIEDHNGTVKKRKSSCFFALTDNLHRLRAACCHPQVGTSGVGSLKRLRVTRQLLGDSDSSVSSRVMTMAQILEKFIDDARNKCEEAMRQAVLHTNAMAAISKLKVEAKVRGVHVQENDVALLEKSCSLYNESLELAEVHAVPSLVRSESILSGSVGFRSFNKIIRNCSIRLEWKWVDREAESAWSQVDFTVSGARKITQLKLRPIKRIPDDLISESAESFKWYALSPKECSLECLVPGGDFARVRSFTCPQEHENVDDFHIESGFRTNKSKSWRLVVKSFYECKEFTQAVRNCPQLCGCYLGVDLELLEASIASDPLQRLHCLHNSSLNLSSLQQLHKKKGESKVDNGLELSRNEIGKKIESMVKEAEKIESLYLGAARSLHNESFGRMDAASSARNDAEKSLCALTDSTKPQRRVVDCWDDCWWDDFLVFCQLNGTEAQHQGLCARMLEEVDGIVEGGFVSHDRTIVPFVPFSDLLGLRTVLQMRIRQIRTGLGQKESRRRILASELRSTDVSGESYLTTPREGRFKCLPGGHALCMKAIAQLSSDPSEGEVMENSRCSVCKSDWDQVGPKCRHCKLGEELEDLTPDRVTLRVLHSLFSLARSGLGSGLKSMETPAIILQRARQFFSVVEASKREMVMAWRCWRAHLDLLNDIDELNQCKSTMRLTFEGEDVTELSADQLNAVLVPMDVHTRYHDHAAKQAMALGALSRAKGTLQYLKNQSTSETSTAGESGASDTCMICLSEFEANDSRAVLKCGHSFCLECTMKHRSSNSKITCPLRCKIRTEEKEVMIASEKSRNDGSRIKRRIKGSYGTKVTRLVSDILDVCDSGDKGLVFSQWEDMLDICQQALADNGVQFVRVKAASKIGECTQLFRSPTCSVMLLNVAKGAEGLTLLEATHVFMVEPLLNPGLDLQACSRIHRIGQQRKTYVWRYLIADTIETKIDSLRKQHQEDQVEDLVHEGKKSTFKAGGIDGGFQTHAELLNILQP